MKNFINVFFLTIFIPVGINAYVASKDVPYEVKVLVESINLDYLTEREKSDLNNSIKSLDSMMAGLDESDKYFLAKSTLYKWVLRNPPNLKVPKDFSVEKIVNQVPSNEFNDFAKWLFLSLKADIIEIIRQPEYQSQKSPKIKKQLSLIAPWVYLFSYEKGIAANLRLVKHQMKALNTLNNQYKLFYKFKSEPIPKQSNTLNYFKNSLAKSLQGNESKNKGNDPLGDLEKVIKKHRRNNLPTPVSEWSSDQDLWKPKDHMIEAKLDDRINKKVENYKAPQNLPQPVDDWGLE